MLKPGARLRHLATAAWALLAQATLGGALAATLPPPAPGVAAAAMAERTRACTTCHGVQGQAGPDGYYPRLAGKPAGYLFRQLQNFRDGRRHYAPMAHLVDTLDDAYLLEMAQYFAQLKVPYPAPVRTPLAPQDAARASALVRQGDAALGIAACQDCHGEALTGIQPDVPGLLGLPADYLQAQLGGWQSGQRRAHAPDCMAGIAKQLQPRDASLLARWLAAQAVPPTAPAQRTAPNGGSYQRLCAPQASAAAPAPSAPAPPTSTDLVARGAYLARIGNCAQCHTPRGGAPYAGGRGIATPFDTVVAGNLTPHPQHGLGRWTADDFWQALHHGVSKDGRALYPAFPYTSTTHLRRADSDALFAYLQTLPASDAPRQPHALRWPFGTQWALQAWRLLYFRPADEGALLARQVPPDVPVAQAPAWHRGAYLVQALAHCDDCHAPRNFLGAVQADTEGRGAVLPGSQWFAPSLLRMRYSPSALQHFLQTGVSPSGYASGPMAEVVLHSTQYLSDSDAQAMALYLDQRARSSTLPPPAASAPPRRAGAVAAPSEVGAKLYTTHCADCHGKSGEGRPGAYPALAGNPAVTQRNTNNLVLGVLHGGYAPSTAGHPRPHGMPPLMLRLSDADIAAVLTHIRSQWGNQASAVAEFDINKLRRAQTP